MKKSVLYKISSVVIVLFCLAFVLVWNNTNILRSGKNPGKVLSLPDSASTSNNFKNSIDSVKTTVLPKVLEKTQKSGDVNSALSKKVRKKTKAARIFIVELTDVLCKPADRQDISVLISVKFYLNDEISRQDALFKREELKIVLKKTMISMKLSEVHKENFRVLLKSAAEEVLGKGSLKDVELTRFQLH